MNKKNPLVLSPIKKPINVEMDLMNFVKRGNTFVSKRIKKLISKGGHRHSLDLRRLNPKKPVIPKSDPTPVDLCLYGLDHLPNQRNSECLQYIKTYLKSLPSFMNIISKEKNLNLSENLIEQISIHLRHEYIPKNNIVCRFGERGEKFYIILKGKVKFFIPKVHKCYLNFEEYIQYLIQLRKNDELGLINNLIVQNKAAFPFEDDNFDLFILNEFQNYLKFSKKFMKSKTIFEKNSFNHDESNNNFNENKKDFISNAINNITTEEESKAQFKNRKKFSIVTYKKIKEVINKMSSQKSFFNENIYLGEDSPHNYLKANNVVDIDLDPKGRKLVNVYKYEEMSTFDNGQTFGYIALQSKSCKRAATAIVVQDSDLGVLTKEEYLEFFEMLSNKEKKNLYELLKCYNLIGSISEYKFIKRYYHYFEYIKFRKNNIVMDINKPIDEVIVFNSGLFVVNICLNIVELNDLITKLKLIKGKLLGLSSRKLEVELNEKRENQDLFMRKNYISSNENKLLSKKYNFTLSIISDHLIIGYPDTVDPFTFKPLFNCTCISAESDGYFISNRSIKLINEDSKVIMGLKNFCLMRLEYNINRLQKFKKEIVSKIRKNEVASTEKTNENKTTSFELKKNKEKSLKEKEKEKEEESDNKGKTEIVRSLSENKNKKYILNRNQVSRKKSRSNNKKPLSLKLNSNVLENTLSRFINEEIKNYDKKKISNQNLNKKNKNSYSKIQMIKKLKESILEKQKRIQFKKELYYSQADHLNNKSNKKEKSEKILKSNLPDYKNNKNYDTDSFINKIKTSLSKDFFFCDYFSKTQKSLNKKIFTKEIDKYNLNNYIKETNNNKIYSLPQNKDNQLTLPSIDITDENNIKKELESLYITSINRYDDSKIKSFKMNKNKNFETNKGYISYDSAYKMMEMSPFPVKEKYIVFKLSSPNTNKKLNIKSINNSQKNKINSTKPLKLKKNKVFDNLFNENYIYEKNNEIENKKNDYYNIITPNKIIKNNFFIKDKFNELNDIVKNMRKTTNEILNNKEEF